MFLRMIVADYAGAKHIMFLSFKSLIFYHIMTDKAGSCQRMYGSLLSINSSKPHEEPSCARRTVWKMDYFGYLGSRIGFNIARL